MIKELIRRASEEDVGVLPNDDIEGEDESRYDIFGIDQTSERSGDGSLRETRARDCRTAGAHGEGNEVG